MLKEISTMDIVGGETVNGSGIIICHKIFL